jgi:hypothetical protein
MESDSREQLREEIEQVKEQRDQQKGWLQRRFGCFGNVIAWLLGLVILALIYTVVDAMAAPWAYSFFGLRPTLVGQWNGAFSAPGGERGVVHLELTHPYLETEASSGTFRWIEGTAQSCIGSRTIQTYEAYGRPNTNGSDVPVELRATAPFRPGYSMQSVRGAWSGEQLTLSGLLGHILDETGSTTYNPNDINQSRNITVVFRKGTVQEFVNACDTLGP